jgi:hypothetical protein
MSLGRAPILSIAFWFLAFVQSSVRAKGLELESAINLIVLIKTSDPTQSVAPGKGACIIVYQSPDRIYIITANHVAMIPR